MVDSMPADVTVSHSHLAIVLLDTGLCERRVERNNFSQFGEDMNSFVAIKYVSKHLRGHSKLSSVKRGKDMVMRDLGFPVFGGLVSVDMKPLGCIFRYRISRSDTTEDLSGNIKANSINSFLVRSFRSILSFSPNEDKYEVAVDTSHVDEYLRLQGHLQSSLEMPSSVV